MAYTASALLAPAAPTGNIWLQSPMTTATLLSLWAFFARQHSPWSFYIYGAFPVYFWHHAFARFRPLMRQPYIDSKLMAWMLGAGWFEALPSLRRC
jgi:hypothetical protein